MVEPVTASTFRVWDPNNEPESDGSDIEADCVEEAAQSYIEADSDYSTDNVDEVDVLVRTSDGKLYEVCVKVEYEVTYRASSVQLREPKLPPLLTSILPDHTPPTRRELHTRTHEDDR
jgi:hypothetical protein